MLLITLNNEAHGCTKHTKWTHTHAEDGNLNTSQCTWIFQNITNCSYWLEKKITFLHLIIVTCIIMTKHIIKKVSLRIMTNNGENLKNAVVYEMPESHLGSTVHCVRWKHLWWIRGRQWNVETECGIIIENVCLNKDYHNYDCLNISSPYKKHWYFSNV